MNKRMINFFDMASYIELTHDFSFVCLFFVNFANFDNQLFARSEKYIIMH